MSSLDEFQKVEVEGDFHLEGYLILRSFFDATEIAHIYDALRQDEVSTISKIKNLLKIGQFDKSDVAIEANSFKYLKHADFWFNDISKLEEVVEMINEESADMVVFTGDLVNNYYHEAIPYVNTLRKIEAKDGKFSILGNHDYCDYVMLKRNSKLIHNQIQ